VRVLQGEIEAQKAALEAQADEIASRASALESQVAEISGAADGLRARLDNAVHERDALKAGHETELAGIATTITDLTAQALALTLERDTLRSTISAEKESAALVAEAVERLTAERDALAVRADQAQRECDERQATVGALEGQADELRVALSGLTEYSQRLEVDRDAVKADVDAAARARDEMADSLRTLEATLEIERQTSRAAADQLAAALTARDDLSRAASALAGEIEEAAAASEARQAEIDALKRALDANNAALEAQAERHRADVEEARSEALTTRDAAMITARREVVLQEIGRLLRRETAKARSYQATPQKLSSWMDNFYGKNEAEIFAQSLEPTVRVHLVAVGSEADATATTEAIVREHFEKSQRDLADVIASDPDQYRTTLERVLTRWETARAVQFADALMQKEIDHARR
jgi:chromosome segregation ATPase